LIAAAFPSTLSARSSIAPDELPSRLDQALGLGRRSWPLPALRHLADALLAASDGRKRSPAHEARWLNLLGFCLRPGFGYPGDDFRIEVARRTYAAGLTYGNRVQCEINWWLLWGRVAGGLNRNQQAELYQRLSGVLLPRGRNRSWSRSRSKPRWNNPALLREMWRTAASLERLPVGSKTELGDALIERVPAGEFGESDVWCLSRLGARELLYGPLNLVVPPATVSRWVEVLLGVPGTGEALAAMARRTDDGTRDLAPAVRERVRHTLETEPHPERLRAIFDGHEEDTGRLARTFGEELPSGLVLLDVDAAPTV